MKTTKTKGSRRGRTALILSAVFLTAAGFFAAINFQGIKHALLLRFGTPRSYMIYVETKYLLARGKEWQENAEAIAKPFSKTKLNGTKAFLSVNHLVFDLLAQYDLALKTDFSGATLFFLYEKNGEDTLFQAAGNLGDTLIASLDFLHSSASDELYIACPQAANAALAISTTEEDPIVMWFQSLGNLFMSFKDSVSHTISSDPYAYLLPYLDIITEITMEPDVPLPVADSTVHALRLDMRLSLDTALETMAAQLTEIKKNTKVSDPLISCYELCIYLLGQLAGRHPADLLIRAYIDENGTVLGHEFFLFSDREIASLTGLLLPDKTGRKSGELTFFSDFGNKAATILLSVSELGFNAEEGVPTGKINLSSDRIPSINFQILLSGEPLSENTALLFPKLTLRARTLGITFLTLEFMPTNTPPQVFPSPQDYLKIYRLSEFSLFLESLDFSGIADNFFNRTGIDLYALAALFHSLFP